MLIRKIQGQNTQIPGESSVEAVQTLDTNSVYCSDEETEYIDMDKQPVSYQALIEGDF